LTYFRVDLKQEEMSAELDVLSFNSQKEWEEWLDDNGNQSKGVWIRIGKKGSGIQTVSYADALESALCYGWIDAVKKSFDAQSWIQLFTPRKPGSKWSRINRDNVLKLLDAGRIRPAGLVAVEKAKESGTWDRAYEPQSTIQIPGDLMTELIKWPEALSFFHSLDSRNRYAILHRIQTAVKPETRTRRIFTFVEMLKARQKIY
jgi:uncharacterized protein YdeI (YjbR/CyaY-like superfamily)